jgi:hypothetical protein
MATKKKAAKKKAAKKAAEKAPALALSPGERADRKRLKAIRRIALAEMRSHRRTERSHRTAGDRMERFVLRADALIGSTRKVSAAKIEALAAKIEPAAPAKKAAKKPANGVASLPN